MTCRSQSSGRGYLSRAPGDQSSTRGVTWAHGLQGRIQCAVGGYIEEWEVCQAIVWRNHLIEEFGQAGPELGPAGEPVLLDTG